ncbi:hypothetical protein COLO4_07015 [Corchorus olitorius]|uniref:Uncharacterized protein n=1 Tax=Corchorus olitorius TaxID=93759 RepID=A0A1R3KL52_9ROSI|nr:hypothetical protein COLO4_07015 [Corchorus olitorius]
MAQKRARLVDGAKLKKKQKSHDLNELLLKPVEPDVLVTTPPLQIIKPTSEVLASQEAKAYLDGVNSLSYSPNYSPERVANSEIVQDSAQMTISPGLSPSIFLNDEEMVEIEELLASGQPDGVVADMWKDIDDVYLSNNPRELGTKLIHDPSIHLAVCNVNVEKRPEIVEDPTIIPIDMNSTPSDENESNTSIVETVRSIQLDGY